MRYVIKPGIWWIDPQDHNSEWIVQVDASGTDYVQYRASGIIDSYWCDKRTDDVVHIHS